MNIRGEKCYWDSKNSTKVPACAVFGLPDTSICQPLSAQTQLSSTDTPGQLPCENTSCLWALPGNSITTLPSLQNLDKASGPRGRIR